MSETLIVKVDDGTVLLVGEVASLPDDLAYTDVANTFTEDQTITGSLTATGTITGNAVNGTSVSAGIIQQTGNNTVTIQDGSITADIQIFAGQGFSGDGSLLTSLPAGQLTGTVADARLSSNVPLKNAANAFSVANAASTPPLSLTGAWFSGGTATTTKPQCLIEATGATSTGWGTTGTGLGINAPGTFSGNLIDCQFNGVSKFKVSFSGSATASGAVTATSFSGAGTSLTNLNASNLGIGTVPTARLAAGTANSTTFLRGDNTWATPSGGGPAGANPTTLIGLSTVNGTATTFMRSDAAPALNVNIRPNWTSQHTFSGQIVSNSAFNFSDGGGAQVYGDGDGNLSLSSAITIDTSSNVTVGGPLTVNNSLTQSGGAFSLSDGASDTITADGDGNIAITAGASISLITLSTGNGLTVDASGDTHVAGGFTAAAANFIVDAAGNLTASALTAGTTLSCNSVFNLQDGSGSQVYGDGSGSLSLDAPAVFISNTSGVVMMTNLPDIDPAVAGQLWNSSGTLKVSTGP